MPKSIVIMQGAEFTLTSTGNGWGYTLRADKYNGRFVWLQDSDATTFREELDAIETAWPNWSVDMVLGYLWSIYDTIAQDAA